MKLFQIAIALLALGGAAHAQGYDDSDLRPYSPYSVGVTYSVSARYGVGLPMGSQANYIDKISPTNLVLEGQWNLPGKLSVGIQTGYQYNQQRLGRSVTQFGDETVSAVQTRTLTTIPALATVAYNFTNAGAAFRPYVQLGAGGAYVDYTNFYGVLADRKNGINAAVAPAVGLKVFGRQGKGLGADIQAQYQHVFFKYNELNNSPSLMLSAGLVYRFY
ncbi:hypothetical protein F5984_18130 [Rudanella paleaurantiibacter]|uniref:Outer membrane beta-barrel protein n=1 Tax=Rudanella paleaurantiibacter TaxID=2614655 RepID=A0A7J5TWC5_9BACT|nr:hypothetical protein [Rudanella paleaurantiibacter]KAB7728746.1 hypothetical protein F5984_18130 [Rudanella paleaurantiibacter]